MTVRVRRAVIFFAITKQTMDFKKSNIVSIRFCVKFASVTLQQSEFITKSLTN